MNYQEILDQSRPLMGKVCKSCLVRKGQALSLSETMMPGKISMSTWIHSQVMHLLIQLQNYLGRHLNIQSLQDLQERFNYTMEIHQMIIHIMISQSEDVKKQELQPLLVMVLIQPSCKLQLNISKKMMVLVYQQSNLGVKKSMMKN